MWTQARCLPAAVATLTTRNCLLTPLPAVGQRVQPFLKGGPGLCIVMSTVVHSLCYGIHSSRAFFSIVASLGKAYFWGINSAPHLWHWSPATTDAHTFPPSLFILDLPLPWPPPLLALESYPVAWPRLLSLRAWALLTNPFSCQALVPVHLQSRLGNGMLRYIQGDHLSSTPISPAHCVIVVC